MGLERLAGTGDGAAGADARNKGVDLFPFHGGDDFRSRGQPVNFRIRRVVELLRHVPVRISRQ